MLSERAIAARRANWSKRRGVSAEGRERQRRACLRDRPWLRSTGPRTAAGKERSRSNAIFLGKRSRTLDPHRLLLESLDADEARSLLAGQRGRERILRAAFSVDELNLELAAIRRGLDGTDMSAQYAAARLLLGRLEYQRTARP